MAKIEQSIIINRPIEEVFPFVIDINNFPKWWPWLMEPVKTSSSPYGVGTTEYEIMGRFYFFIKVKNVSIVSEYQPNKKISRNIKSPHFPPWSTTYDFESIEGGTKLTYIIQWEPDGLLKLLTPFFATLFTIMEQKIPLSRLKKYLESGCNNSNQ